MVDFQNAGADDLLRRKTEEDALRDQIGRMMAEGLETQTEPFPETSDEFEKVLVEMRLLAPDDLLGRVVITGFINHPVNDQSCENCIYYLAHRKFCDLPELALPVEPNWWCRLWRI